MTTTNTRRPASGNDPAENATENVPARIQRLFDIARKRGLTVEKFRDSDLTTVTYEIRSTHEWSTTKLWVYVTDGRRARIDEYNTGTGRFSRRRLTQRQAMITVEVGITPPDREAERKDAESASTATNAPMRQQPQQQQQAADAPVGDRAMFDLELKPGNGELHIGLADPNPELTDEQAAETGAVARRPKPCADTTTHESHEYGDMGRVAGKLGLGRIYRCPGVVATDTRQCVTCSQVVYLVPGTATTYRHANSLTEVDHPAEPRLAHPMDVDPFGGIPGAHGDDLDELFADVTPPKRESDRDLTADDDTRTCWAPGDQEHDHEMCNDVVAEEREQAAAELADHPAAEHCNGHPRPHGRQDDLVFCSGRTLATICQQAREDYEYAQNEGDDETFPPAEPEPSISLAAFQQRVQAGEWSAAAGLPIPNLGLVEAAETQRQEDERRRADLEVTAACEPLTPQEAAAAIDQIAAYADKWSARPRRWTGGRYVHAGQITYRTRKDPRARTRRTRATNLTNRGN